MYERLRSNAVVDSSRAGLHYDDVVVAVASHSNLNLLQLRLSHNNIGDSGAGELMFSAP
jgi:hypothetical protein